jgi:hypothetical protein
MARNPLQRAEDRASLRDAAIRDALADGNAHKALLAALDALMSEAAKLRRRRAGDGALTDAQMAGSLSVLAAQLHLHKPDRPAGCPRVPRPEDLRAAYEAAVAAATEGDPQ